MDAQMTKKERLLREAVIGKKWARAGTPRLAKHFLDLPSEDGLGYWPIIDNNMVVVDIAVIDNTNGLNLDALQGYATEHGLWYHPSTDTFRKSSSETPELPDSADDHD